MPPKRARAVATPAGTPTSSYPLPSLARPRSPPPKQPRTSIDKPTLTSDSATSNPFHLNDHRRPAPPTQGLSQPSQSSQPSAGFSQHSSLSTTGTGSTADLPSRYEVSFAARHGLLPPDHVLDSQFLKGSEALDDALQQADREMPVKRRIWRDPEHGYRPPKRAQVKSNGGSKSNGQGKVHKGPQSGDTSSPLWTSIGLTQTHPNDLERFRFSYTWSQPPPTGPLADLDDVRYADLASHSVGPSMREWEWGSGTDSTGLYDTCLDFETGWKRAQQQMVAKRAGASSTFARLGSKREGEINGMDKGKGREQDYSSDRNGRHPPPVSLGFPSKPISTWAARTGSSAAESSQPPMPTTTLVPPTPPALPRPEDKLGTRWYPSMVRGGLDGVREHDYPLVAELEAARAASRASSSRYTKSTSALGRSTRGTELTVAAAGAGAARAGEAQGKSTSTSALGPPPTSATADGAKGKQGGPTIKPTSAALSNQPIAPKPIEAPPTSITVLKATTIKPAPSLDKTAPIPVSSPSASITAAQTPHPAASLSVPQSSALQRGSTSTPLIEGPRTTSSVSSPVTSAPEALPKDAEVEVTKPPATATLDDVPLAQLEPEEEFLRPQPPLPLAVATPVGELIDASWRARRKFWRTLYASDPRYGSMWSAFNQTTWHAPPGLTSWRPPAPGTDDFKIPSSYRNYQNPFHPSLNQYLSRSTVRVFWVVPVHGPVVIPDLDDPVVMPRAKPWSSEGEYVAPGVDLEVGRAHWVGDDEAAPAETPEGAEAEAELEKKAREEFTRLNAKSRGRPAVLRWTRGLLQSFIKEVTDVQARGDYGALHVTVSGPKPDPWIERDDPLELESHEPIPKFKWRVKQDEEAERQRQAQVQAQAQAHAQAQSQSQGQGKKSGGRGKRQSLGKAEQGTPTQSASNNADKDKDKDNSLHMAPRRPEMGDHIRIYMDASCALRFRTWLYWLEIEGVRVFQGARLTLVGVKGEALTVA